MFELLQLHEDRFFSSDPQTRSVARELYQEAKDLPLVCPHGHVPPVLLAENAPFPEPASLIIIPDHYIFRMLYSQGIRLEDLGVPTRDGTSVEQNARKIWQRFANHYHLFAGTPTGAWLNHVLFEVFGVRYKLSEASAMYIYDQIQERLATPAFLPRTLFKQFNIEVLTTTDAATDPLEHHSTLLNSGWDGRVIPCFRPDALFDIAAPDWDKQVEHLSQRTNAPVDSFAAFLRALENRRLFFKSMGAVSTDHAVLTPYTKALTPLEAEILFQKGMEGAVTNADSAQFQAGMLMEMARMSLDDGLVMQIHPGSYRDHNRFIARRFGKDKGADIPVATEYTYNLANLLNTYGNEADFRVVVFSLDESTYSRELAPLAGHYPAMRLGPPWWFFDSIAGMTRFRERVTETAGIYNTAGFNDDTRAFCSIPARHDLCRRVDANYLANLVTRHIIDQRDARVMMRDMTYNLVRDTYRLTEEPRTA